MDGMTRRSALLAAAAASMSATELLAEGQGPGEGKKPILLHIVLPDGQSIDLKASEVIIDFGVTAKLAVTPSGILPVAAAGHLDPAGAPFPSDTFGPSTLRPDNTLPPAEEPKRTRTRTN